MQVTKTIGLLLTGVCAVCGCEKLETAKSVGAPTKVSVVSPDRRNEIRLTVGAEQFGYQVFRDGVQVVADGKLGMKVGGRCLKPQGEACRVTRDVEKGVLDTPIYKKAAIDLSANCAFVDFGDWGVRLSARNDGVAYRFETKMAGKVRVECENASIRFADKSTPCTFNTCGAYGAEENVPTTATADDVKTCAKSASGWNGNALVYLPFVFSVGGKYVAVTESDVHDYPLWNLERDTNDVAGVTLRGNFAGWPKKTQRVGGWGEQVVEEGGRWVRVLEHEKWLCETKGSRTFPWRTFVLCDAPVQFCEADIVFALASPAVGGDFSWVKPGKVAWDWWNCFDNLGMEKGCTTKGYERFIDFAASNGVEYVIFDEGWSEALNIWKFEPRVDVPHLIDYANKRGVGIILWMAWAQVYGCEEKVASHFAKLGAKGFKVDFMDRADAEIFNFLDKFAAACVKEKMLVDYHGVCHPTGLSRTYPNVLNYEGVHGLEQMKFYGGKDMMANDVDTFFLRMTAGPLDYTPGAMINYPVGKYPMGEEAKKANTYQFPGSMGTRCHQMAMMVLYEAPLQMLCDSPTNYEKNMECFSFMSATPVVWKDTVGLGGALSSFVAAARQAKDGSWYAAGLTNNDGREFVVDTSFLGAGEWKAEIFRDADDADAVPSHYVHETGKTVKAGERVGFKMAKGGGFVVKFTK